MMRLGQEWIRTTEGVKPADLQSAPFGHFGTYPEIISSLAFLSLGFGVVDFLLATQYRCWRPRI